MKRIVTGVAVLAMTAGGALAQSDRDWKLCNGDDDTAAIPACTRLIGTRKLTRSNMSVAHYNRGLSHRRKDQLDQALADYTKAIEFNGTKADIYNNRGVVYELKRQFDNALADYAKAIQLNPKSPNPYSNRGDVYRKLGNFDKAISEYNLAIGIDPNRAVDHTDVAESYMLTGQFDLAVASASRAIGLEKDRASAHYARGLSAYYIGQYSLAGDDLRRSADLRTHSYSVIYLYLARARMGQLSTVELEGDAARLTAKGWPLPVIEMLAGKRTTEAVLQAARGASEQCDAHYFGAQYHLLRDNAGEHAAGLRSAAQVCPSSDYEFMGVRAELSRLGEKGAR
jgi:tetratricopeptide (TPR) repeat protein